MCFALTQGVWRKTRVLHGKFFLMGLGSGGSFQHQRQLQFFEKKCPGIIILPLKTTPLILNLNLVGRI